MSAVLYSGAGPRGPEAAVFGEWNTSNLGDRAIHHGVLRFFQSCGWNTRPYGISTLTPLPADAAHNPVAPAAPGWMSRTLTRAPALKRTLRGLRQEMKAGALSPQLRESQAIVVGGGALLLDLDLHFPQSLLQLARCARRLGKPLLCLGCGVEGEWSRKGGRMIREFLSACDLVAVRDTATAARVREVLGEAPPVFGDFCLHESCITQETGTAGVYAFAINAACVPHAFAPEQARYEDALMELMRGLAKKAQPRRKEILVFTTGTDEDIQIAQRVFARAGVAGSKLYLARELGQLSSILRSSELVIATRLHAAIFALASQIPVVGFSAGAKLGDFFASFGMRHCVYDVTDQPRLAGWLDSASYGKLRDEQRRALVAAPFWYERARVRQYLGALAGKAVACT